MRSPEIQFKELNGKPRSTQSDQQSIEQFQPNHRHIISKN